MLTLLLHEHILPYHSWELLPDNSECLLLYCVAYRCSKNYFGRLQVLLDNIKLSINYIGLPFPVARVTGVW